MNLNYLHPYQTIRHVGNAVISGAERARSFFSPITITRLPHPIVNETDQSDHDLRLPVELKANIAGFLDCNSVSALQLASTSMYNPSWMASHLIFAPSNAAIETLITTPNEA